MKTDPAEPTNRRRLVIAVTSVASYRLLEGLPDFLSRSGWDIHLVADAVPATAMGGMAHALPMRREPSPLLDLIALLKWVRLLHRLRPTVLLTGTPKAALLSTLAARLVRVPRVVYMVRGLRLETVKGPMGVLLWILEWLTCSLAHDVIAVSPSLRDELAARRLVGSKRVTVLGKGSSNGVDLETFTPVTPDKRATARRLFALPMHKFVVGYAGRIHADKGVEDLLRATQDSGKLPVTLLLAGDVEDHRLAVSISNAAGGSLDIRLLPKQTDMATWYAALDLLCLPSRREGFPNVVLEAAASGIPAIVSNATGCRDSVLDGITGWIYRREDWSDLQRKLHLAATERNSLTKMGTMGRRWVEKEFDREIVWRRLSEYLDASESPSPHGFDREVLGDA